MPKPITRIRLDLWELLLALVMASLVAYALGVWRGGAVLDLNEARRQGELDELEQRWGPDHHSEFVEEWVVRDFFSDSRDGTFLDVGSSHYRRFSNTYFLETQLGWSGIAVDALPEFAPDYQRYRPRTQFFSFFVSDVSDQQARMYVLKHNSLVSSGNRDFTAQWGSEAGEVNVTTITLNDLLEGQQVTKLDFLSMDIELAEPKALAGFDIERYRPRFVCIEGHREVRQQILDYFARHGYVLVGKYLRADPQNLYFRPIDAAPGS